jgi:hypothetical protein
MEILIQRDNAFALFRNLNKALLDVYLELKTQYETSPPPSTEINNSLKVIIPRLFRHGRFAWNRQSLPRFSN